MLHMLLIFNGIHYFLCRMMHQDLVNLAKHLALLEQLLLALKISSRILVLLKAM